jgi:hypothetical protein
MLPMRLTIGSESMPIGGLGSRATRKHLTKGGFIREAAYLSREEEQALEDASEERCSKSEVTQRSLRQYLGIED